MKISIKKKYVASTTSFVSIVLGFHFLLQIYNYIADKNLYILLLPSVFVFCALYTINYIFYLRSRNELVDGASKEAANYIPDKVNLIKAHLLKKLNDEAYTLNFFNGKLKFTTNWNDQDIIDKQLRNRNEN